MRYKQTLNLALEFGSHLNLIGLINFKPEKIIKLKKVSKILGVSIVVNPSTIVKPIKINFLV